MEIIQDGLVLYLDGVKNTVDTHDDTAKIWIDKTGNGNNATIINCGWKDTGLYFHGIVNQSYAKFGEINPELLTIEVRMDLDRVINQLGDGTDYFLANCQNGGYFFEYNKGIIRFAAHINGSYVSVNGSSTQQNKINYYSVTYDGNELILYENGIQVDKAVAVGVIKAPTAGTPLVLGGHPDKNGKIVSQEFKGTIYSVRMYDRGLTAEEIKNNYDYDVAYFNRPPISKNYELEWDAITKNFVSTSKADKLWCDHWSRDGYHGYWTYYYRVTAEKALFGCAIINDVWYGLVISTNPTIAIINKTNSGASAIYTSYRGEIIYNGYTWYIAYDTRGMRACTSCDWNKNRYIGSGFSSIESAAKAMLDKSDIVYSERQIHPPQTDRIKYVKVREDDGTYSDAILLAVDALNVDFPDNENLIQKMAKKAEKAIYSDNGINLGRNYSEGIGTNTNAFGFSNSIPGDYGVAEGQNNIIYGQFGHTEGQENIIDATTEYGHAEGYKNQVNGNYGHAEGYKNQVNGNYGHTEGQENIVSGIGAHAEGLRNAATGDYSHAQGQNNVASGVAAAVMGEGTTAEGIASLAIGKGTTAKGNYSFVHGKYNSTKNYDRYAEIVGGGKAPEAGNNIYTLDWEGNAKFKGNVSAEVFNGKATKDIKGRNLTSYIRELSAEKNVLTYVKGDGTKERVTLTGWENVQEKYNSLTNENAITVGKSQREIISMEYRNATSHISNAIFQSILVVYAGVDPGQTHAVVKFDIRIDDVSVDALFIPTETLCKGYHIINLMYPVMDIEPEVLHTISVVATCTTGNIAIGQNNIKTVFYGMGINSGKTRWDGRIDIGDHLETITIIPKRRSPYITFIPPIDNGPSIHIDEPRPKLVFEEYLGAVTIKTRKISPIEFSKFNAYPELLRVETRYIFSSVKWPYYTFDERYINVQETNLYQLRTNFNVLATKENIDNGISEKLPLELERFSKFTQIEIKEDYIG